MRRRLFMGRSVPPACPRSQFTAGGTRSPPAKTPKSGYERCGLLKTAVALACLSLLFAAPALATPASVPAPFPWIDGEAEPLLVDGDTVYVGGTFDAVGTAAGPLVLADGGDASLLK